MLIRAFGLDKPRQQGSVGLMSFLNGQFELKESQHLEFKEAAGGLPLDVWESDRRSRTPRAARSYWAFMRIGLRINSLLRAFPMLMR